MEAVGGPTQNTYIYKGVMFNIHMAGRKTYDLAKEFIKQLKGEGFKDIGLMSLREKIMMHLGSDERTIEKYLKLMLITKLIKDTGVGCRFKIL